MAVPLNGGSRDVDGAEAEAAEAEAAAAAAAAVGAAAGLRARHIAFTRHLSLQPKRWEGFTDRRSREICWVA